MSSEQSVTVICDKCGNKDKEDSGSFVRAEWVKVSVGIIHYDGGKPYSRGYNRKAMCDFCEACAKGCTEQELVRYASELVKKSEY